MPQLVRDNAADNRVTDDVARLAAAYDDDAVASSLDAMRAARTDDLGLLAAVFAEPADAGEPVWRQVATQLMRHRLYVGVAVAFIALVVFVSPVPRPVVGADEGGTALLPTFGSHEETVPTVAPAFDAAPTSNAFDFAAPRDDAAAPVERTPVSSPPAGPRAPGPRELRITESGYASAYAPTPAEQEPPKNGLPAESIAGRVTKYSYVRLAGDARTLRLRALSDEGASTNASAARVQLCQITTDWEPSRATPASAAPAYSAQCIEGAAGSNGVWSFAFSELFNPAERNGWAIVPVTAGNATFRVTFAPTAA